MNSRDLKGASVVLMGAFDYEYPREKVLREGFELAGARVFECRYSESTTFPSPQKLLWLPWIYWTLARELAEVRRRTDTIDIVVVTKFNPLLLPLAAFYARRLDAVLVYDLFVSLHRTAEMRGVPWPVVKSVYLVERATYKLPDHLLVCTNQFMDLYEEMYRIPRHRFIRVPPAADEDRFYPRDKVEDRQCIALYWGNFLPHHGVETIVNAATELEDSSNVEFVFLGTGPREEAAKRIARERGLSNVSFEGFVSDDELHQWIADAHVCLGVFSADPRAMASITNKVCESIASKKATLTEDSPAIREWFTPGENIYTVPPEDPEALATAIRTICADVDLRERLEDGAFEIHNKEFSPERISELLSSALGPLE